MKIRIKKRNFPITVILFRLLLAFILPFIILSGRQKIAALLFILIALWSFLESLIHGQKSQLRSVIDLLADKLLVNLTAIALAVVGMLPFWVMLVFLVRDLLTIIGGSYLFYKDIRREFKPTLIGKITLFLQIIALITVILGQIDSILIWTAAILTITSALELFFKSEFRLAKKTDINEFRISNLIKFADIFTLANMVFGLVAIFFAIKEYYPYMVISLFLGVICDYADGKLARKFGQQNAFGKELDSLADTISFGVAPAIFGFSLTQTPLAIFSFAIFLFCGILRLARYNIMNLKNEYEGMPITLNGILIPSLFLFKVPVGFYPYIYIVLGILMISSLKFRRI